MKYAFCLVLACIIGLFACKDESGSSVNNEAIKNPISADGKVDSNALPAFEFENEVYDFGKVTDGEKISFSFKFRNTGNSDLVISNASASCGCTVPHWPEAPVEPGDEGKIDVVFDTKGKTGIQSKSITVVANTIPNTKVIYLRGEVLPAK